MTHTLKVASIQMDVTPGPVRERLERAERLAGEAAQAGAQLSAFPEVFNTGYAYHPQNYQLAETLDGPTCTWMRQTAARLHAHLAGTWLLRDQTDIYNALILMAPVGRYWRYNKYYPWAWERAYFRDDHRAVVAHTDLGDIGLLDFWLPDGKVELVVYAHSLDFEKKAYRNLVELALLQACIASQMVRPAGRLIKWRVLQNSGSELLLLSEYILDCKRYHAEFVDVTWCDCDLPKGLNDAFYNAAFNAVEQEFIKTTCCTDNAAGRPDTEDKGFLLGVAEVRGTDRSAQRGSFRREAAGRWDRICQSQKSR